MGADPWYSVAAGRDVVEAAILLFLTGSQDMTDNQQQDAARSGSDAKRLAVQILETGSVEWPNYVMRRMAERRMTSVDVENIIRGGWVDQVEQVNEGPRYGTWRYRFTAREMSVVVEFPSDTEMTVVTAWRL
jgi:hypothetical protein